MSMTVTEWIRKSLLAKIPDSPYGHIRDSLDELLRTERSVEFRRMAQNRLIFGAFRYGRMGEKGKPQYDRLASIRQRLDLYDETHNQEFLVDCYNLLEMEYVEPTYDDAHFDSIDDGVHVQVKERR